MELRQLEYFIAVAEEANFTRAAERVHISQSGVSAQIRQLERELGSELFDRSSRVAKLTAAGRAALEPARAAVAAAAELGQVVDEVGGLLRGRVAIGMVIGCTITPLFEGLEKFHRQYPDVVVALQEGNSRQMIDDLRGGVLDVALLGVAGGVPDDLTSMTIVSEGLCLLVARGHELAGRARVSVAELTGAGLITMPRGTGVRTTFDTACASAGSAPIITLEASAADAIADLAARGLGAGVLTESMSATYTDTLVVVPLDDVAVPALLSLVWGPSTNPALRALIPELRAAFGA
jgi:DNA-binding transcriptional LysR family regulator